MENFKIVKHGYNRIEVDSYLDRLKYDYESRLSEQKDRIFYLKDQIEKLTNSSDNELMSSLVSAVERARMIENSSKNIYELETKKLNLLYSKMEELLKDDGIIINRTKKEEFLLLIQDCRKSLQSNIQAQQENIRESTVGDPIKRLLSKMIDFNKITSSNEEIKAPTAVVQKKEQVEIVEKKDVPFRKIDISKVSNEVEVDSCLDKGKKQEGKLKPDLAEFDKFLSKGKNSNGTNFESIMFSSKKKESSSQSEHQLKQDETAKKYDLTPNESGFDLKAAVNPKEDLNEIMKAFDFFNDNKKKN